MRKKILMMMVVIGLAGAAWAGGLTAIGTVNNESGNAVGGGKLIEVINQSGTIYTTPASPYVTGGTVQETTQTDPSSNIEDSNGYFIGRSNATVVLRAWNGATAAAVISAKGYYGYSSAYSLGATTDTPKTANLTIKTDYKADKPDKPGVSVSGYRLTYSDTSKTYNVSFSVAASAGTAYKTEITGWKIRIKKKGTDWAAARPYTGSSATVTEDPQNPFFNTTDTYVAQSQASNYFGDSDWGTEYEFSIPPTGGVGGAASFDFRFYAAATDKLVVNSIFLPSKSLTKPKAATVNKASDLAAVINEASGSKIVTAICKWDPAAGKAVSAIFDSSGSLTTTDFDLALGEGYQIYTTKDLTVTLQ